MLSASLNEEENKTFQHYKPKSIFYKAKKKRQSPANNYLNESVDDTFLEPIIVNQHFNYVNNKHFYINYILLR